MAAIWLLSTRGRPEACQQVLDACTQAGMTSHGVVYVDETVEQYRDIRLPANWDIHYEPVWGSLHASLEWCFAEFPDASQYGWLADDTYPQTPGFDKLIEQAAGYWHLAYCRDLWLSEQENTRPALLHGADLSSGLCWGGELIRTVGAWAVPPTAVQAGIDVAWTYIVRPLCLYRYLDDVIVEHRNWRTGKRAWDTGDDWVRDGLPYVETDLIRLRDWAASDDFRAAIARIQHAAGDSASQGRVHAEIELSHIRERANGNELLIPNARKLKLQALADGIHSPEGAAA